MPCGWPLSIGLPSHFFFASVIAFFLWLPAQGFQSFVATVLSSWLPIQQQLVLQDKRDCVCSSLSEMIFCLAPFAHFLTPLLEGVGE